MAIVLLVDLQRPGQSTSYGTHHATTHALVTRDRFRNNRRPRRRQVQLIEHT
jgi:hypothetical protein